MKTLKKAFYILFLSVAVIATGCSKDDDNNNEENNNQNNSGEEFLTAMVDGTNFEAAQDPAVIIGATVSNNILAVQGGKNNGETIRATITNYTGPGTYMTGDNLQNANSLTYLTLTPTASWMSTFNIGSGTIEVTSDDGTTV
ncbi:MAG: hypothetical protein HKN48_00305, partial [Flavobacteriaceae bacterium]|nr:hypothetical protein [Flavobacteriaceae bacterium]